jgi:hypothetical protein
LREGAKSVVGLLERMKRGTGIKGLDDKSSGMEILMAEAVYFRRNQPHRPLKYFYLFCYESRKREVKTRLIYEDRCDERLKN